MGRNPPEGMQRIIPYLSYADAPAAIDFLCKAFGFEERFRYPLPDGRVGHAELGYLVTVLMLATADKGFVEMLLRLPSIQGLVTPIVGDVYAHLARAQTEAETIAVAPKNEHRSP